jgi:hypothetical protein
MLRQVKLKVITENNYYNQIPQTSDIQWSFLNRVKGEKDSFEELFLNVKCREFFGDLVVCGNLNIDTPSIYGLRLKDKRISVKKTLLSVSMNEGDVEGFAKRLRFLRQIEGAMGIKKTRIYPTQHNATDYTKLVLVGDKKWISSPLLISLYTAIIRSLTYSFSKLTFKDHINELITGSYSYGNDACTFKRLKDCEVDIVHLLTNIDVVLGDNPLTGLNDTKLIVDKKYIKTESDSVGLSHLGRITYWSTYNNHSQHGLMTFLDKIRYAPAGRPIADGIGAGWANNYKNLKEQELISNTVVQPIPSNV